MANNYEDIFDGDKHVGRIYEENERDARSWRKRYFSIAAKDGIMYDVCTQRIYANDTRHPQSWKAILENGMIIGIVYADKPHDSRSWRDYFVGKLRVAHIVANDIAHPESWREDHGYLYDEYSNTKHGFTYKERIHGNDKKNPASWRRIYEDGNCVSYTVGDDNKNEESWVLKYAGGTVDRFIVADNLKHPKSYEVVRYSGQPTRLIKYGDGRYDDLDQIIDAGGEE